MQLPKQSIVFLFLYHYLILCDLITRRKILYYSNALSKASDMLCMNNIRNAIAHRTFNMDVINQRINFIDKNKDKERINSLYFVEFGVLCLKLFYKLNVLYEMKHQLEMFYLVVVKREKQNYGLSK